jgi:chemotaxis signal transduction protein
MSPAQASGGAGSSSGFASSGVGSLGDTDAVVVFDLGVQRYALAATATREVVPVEKLLPVPKTFDAVLGLFPLRGAALALIDTSRLLGLENAGGTKQALVLVKGETALCGLTVDNVVGVVRIDASTFTPGDQSREPGVLGFLSTPQAGTFTLLDTKLVLQRIDALRF